MTARATMAPTVPLLVAASRSDILDFKSLSVSACWIATSMFSNASAFVFSAGREYRKRKVKFASIWWKAEVLRE